MSLSNIPEKIRLLLWGKAAGRCEYAGCNRPLWLDSLTKCEFNTAYIAHIVADSPDGPRGDPVLSSQLAQEISNLMLMCDEHHRLIDKGDVAAHPADRLKIMKTNHENRIEILTAIALDKRSHVLLYGANIGSQSSPLSFAAAARAMVPDYYPADPHPIELGLQNSSFEDTTAQFWDIESEHLRNMITHQVRPRLRSAEISHLSIFALAPQPLLILLGSLLSDIPAAEVFQLHREPQTWKWQDDPKEFGFAVDEPSQIDGEPALVFALSATVTADRVQGALGRNAPTWQVTIPTPHNDFLASRKQAQVFRQQMRLLMDRIKARHGSNATIHVFPAMPVALAVEFGRIQMPKADLPLIVYDENKRRGGFTRAIRVSQTDASSPC